MSDIKVALEVGQKRVFAVALEWPGWTRSGSDEAGALEALVAYAERYQHAVSPRRLGFKPPNHIDAFEVVERMKGDATTDFGAPHKPPKADDATLTDAELKRLVHILEASWDVLDSAVAAATGKELTRGPRGGGRDVNKILEHVFGAHYSYLRQIYYREPHDEDAPLKEALKAVKQADDKALAFAVTDEMPAEGPRGGTLWKPRYFARRAAWHILDHAWEMEDRTAP